MEKNVIDWIALIIVIMGALNWGAIAFGFDFVYAFLGPYKLALKIAYGVVGAAGLYTIYFLIKTSKSKAAESAYNNPY